MRSQTPQFLTRDMTVLGGWLFADLLLGLMLIFLVAVPPTPKSVTPPPVLQVDAKSLSQHSPQCQGGPDHPSCTVTLQETTGSLGAVDWSVASDMPTARFSPAQGTLEPGQSVPIIISNFPCQDGGFLFSGSKGAVPLNVFWTCTPPPTRLDYHYQKFYLTVHDLPGLLAGTSSAFKDIEQQVRSQSILAGQSVGLAIVYGGAPDPGAQDIGQAQNVAGQVYKILASLGQEGFVFQNASYYGNLYVLSEPDTFVEVDVYFFQK